MSISTTTTSVTYAGNNSDSTPYPLTGINYVDSTHIKVFADGVDISSDGLNYCTFTGDGTTGAGEFITSLAYAPTVAIEVFLTPDLDQPVSLQETGSLPAKTLENQGFDRLNMQIRWLARRVANCFTLGNTEDASSTGTADNLLGFDGSGDIAEIPNTTFLQQDNNLSELANAPDQAAAQTNLNVDPAGTDNSTDVTKAGAGTYISLAGQVLTVDEITEGDLNASINASLDKADTALQSGVAAASDIVDFDTEVANNTTVAANTSASHAAVTKSGTPDYVSLTGQDIVVAQVDLATDVTGDLPIANLNAGTNASASTFWRGDGTWFAPSGAGDMVASIYDPDNNALPIGTVQGTGATTLNIVAADEGTITSTTVRGESSVDLQMDRLNGDEVASGIRSGIFAGRRNKATAAQAVAIGGTSNTSSGNDGVVSGNQNANVSPRGVCMGGIVNSITGAGSNHVVLGGTNNVISAASSHSGIFAGNNNTVSGGNSAVLGGQRNDVSGINAVALGATDGVASGTDTLIAGGDATASHDGARVFGDTSVDPISSIANNEFAVQGSALRLVDGNQGAGKILTSDANGSGNWADNPVGTVQGTGANTYNIVAADEGTVAGDARGENSVDLQMTRSASTMVASGTKSALIGGIDNTATNQNSVCLGGARNTAGGIGAVVLGGSDSNASTGFSLVSGSFATADNNGARVFADNSANPITSRQANEFAIQASALRLEDGNEAVGKVLTCNHADGSSNWAAPAKVVYTVATLPAGSQGDVAMVTDATATTFHSVVAGTGSNIVPVFNDGTDWRIG